jgi:hypothetical protein
MPEITEEEAKALIVVLQEAEERLLRVETALFTLLDHIIPSRPPANDAQLSFNFMGDV